MKLIIILPIVIICTVIIIFLFSNRKGIYATSADIEYYTSTISPTTLITNNYIKNEKSDDEYCYNSELRGKIRTDDQFCKNNLTIKQIFLVYCKNNINQSPLQYKEQGNEGDCPGRDHIFLYKNGKYKNPSIAKDKDGNRINLKDLSFDIGIDIDFNNQEVKMNDVHITDKIKLEDNKFLIKIPIGKSNNPIQVGKCEYHMILCENL